VEVDSASHNGNEAEGSKLAKTTTDTEGREDKSSGTKDLRDTKEDTEAISRWGEGEEAEEGSEDITPELAAVNDVGVSGRVKREL